MRDEGGSDLVRRLIIDDNNNGWENNKQWTLKKNEQHWFCLFNLPWRIQAKVMSLSLSLSVIHFIYSYARVHVYGGGRVGRHYNRVGRHLDFFSSEFICVTYALNMNTWPR